MESFYKLVIRDKENNIVGIGRINYKEDIFFTALDEFTDKSIHSFENEELAIKHLINKSFEKTIYMSKRVSEEVEKIYGYPMTLIYSDKYMIPYREFRNIVEVSNSRLTE